jgi:hypothetical protein
LTKPFLSVHSIGFKGSSSAKALADAAAKAANEAVVRSCLRLMVMIFAHGLRFQGWPALPDAAKGSLFGMPANDGQAIHFKGAECCQRRSVRHVY